MKIALMAVILLCVALSGCSTLTTLQAVVDVTASAVPILEAAGVPIPPQVPAYIGAVANCIATVPATPTSSELLTISSCLASQIAPTLPPGIPQAVANVIASIIKDVQAYLAANPPATSVPTAKAPKHFSTADVAKFQAMHSKAQGTVTSIRAFKSK